MYVRDCRLQKTCLDQCLKSLFSKQPLTVNMLKGPKHLSNLHDLTFIISFITMVKTDLDKVCLIDV